MGDTTGATDARRTGTLRVAVLVDLERRAAAGGHVKFWEHIAHAAADYPGLELALHFQGPARRVEQWATNVEVHTHRPVLNSAWIPGLADMPDHTDLAPWHPGLAAQLRNADVVHSTDALFAFARTARRWCRWYGTPLVTSLHTDSVAYCELYARETVSRWLRGLCGSRAHGMGAAIAHCLRAAMERRTRRHLQQSAHILASGARLRALGRSMSDTRMSQLRRGLDPEIFCTHARTGRSRAQVKGTLGIPESASVICFSGRLSAGKRVVRVARTAAALIDKGYDLHVVFAGQGPQAGLLESILGNRAHVLGHIAQTELADVLRAADAFVFPSQVEIWANAVAEARACGLPVVVDAQGGGQLVARPGEDGLVVADDDAAWVSAVQLLLDHPERRQATRVAGLRQHAATVPTWQHVLTDDLLEPWRECVMRTAPAAVSAADLRA